MRQFVYIIFLLLSTFYCYAQNLSQIEGKSPSHFVSIKKNQTVAHQPIKVEVVAPAVVKRGKREALLIGNSAYLYGKKLGANPINDANDLGKNLKTLGFNVIVIQNTTLEMIKQAVRDFEIRIKGAEMATFFFAGHGIETEGKKYIIPVDAKLESSTDAKERAYDIDILFERLRNGGAKHSLIILDACRSDPYPKDSHNDSQLVRALSNDKDRGFSPFRINKMPEGNVYLAMATGWGRVALNGTGRNGVYSKSLLNAIKAGERLERVFDKAGVDVKKETQNKQNPQFVKEVSIYDEFVF